MKFSLQKKTVVFVLLIAAIIATVSAAVSYTTYSTTTDTRYKSTAMDLASTTAALTDADKIADYASQMLAIYRKNPAPEFSTPEEESAYYAQFVPIQDAYYSELYSMMQKIKANNQDILYLYLFVLDPDSHTGVYLIDADTGESACPMGTWDIIYPENYEIFSDPARGFPAYITHSDFGWLCSAGVPIITDSGDVVGYAMVDVSMEEVMADRSAFLRLLLLAVFVVTILLTLVFINIIGRVIVRPINQLALATSSFVSDYHAEKGTTGILQLKIHTGDEIENLADSIQKMEKDIGQYISNLATVTAEKERIGAELSVATQIQADMLPSIFPAFPNHPEFDIYATMTPAKEVGGDFYDFFLIDDDHLCMVMADVSGKGVPAALFMVIAKTLLKNCAQTGLTPKQILETVNNQLVEGNKAEMFVTVWLGILQLSTGTLVAANAGHEYPVIKRANGTFELVKDRHGFVLAGMENVRYRQYELQIEAGDILFLYTDGVPEATDSSNQMFGTQRMLDALNQCTPCHPQALLASVKTAIDDFVGDAQQFDDITMLALEMKAFTRRYRLNLVPTLDATEQATAFVEESLQKENVPLKLIYKVNIAVDEIFSNIARYSKATESSIICFVQDQMINIRFEDNGFAFDPLSIDDPDTSLPAEQRKTGGLGIYMVKKSMSHVFYERRNERNQFTIQLAL